MNFSQGQQKQTAHCHFRDKDRKSKTMMVWKKIKYKWLEAVFLQTTMRKYPGVTKELRNL